MRRKAVLVTAVGTDATGRPWCTLSESFMRPGDEGWIGPFALVEVRHSSDGRLLHFLKPGADPYVDELLALIQINSDAAADVAVARDKVSTQRKQQPSAVSKLRSGVLKCR